MNKPTLSIVTINFNNVKGLEETCQSVLNQEIQRGAFEWIVIDGGSTDESIDYLKNIENHIDQWVSEPDKGIYDAMNKGMNLANGEFLWFLNSGDRFHSRESIKCFVEAYKAQSDGDVFYSDTQFVDENYQALGLISKLKPQKFPVDLTKNSFRFGMNICHQSIIVRRKIAPAYDLQYKQSSDIDWILRVLSAQPKTVRVEAVLSDFQVGGSSYENSTRAMNERYEIFKKHFGFLPNMLAHVWIVIRRVLFNLKVR